MQALHSLFRKGLMPPDPSKDLPKYTQQSRPCSRCLRAPQECIHRCPGGGVFSRGGKYPPPSAPQAAHVRRRPCAHSHLLFGNQHGEAASCRATRVLGAGKTFCARKSVTRRRGAALSTRQTRKAISGRLVQKDPLGGGLGSWGWSKTPTNRQTVPFKLGKICPVRA